MNWDSLYALRTVEETPLQRLPAELATAPASGIAATLLWDLACLLETNPRSVSTGDAADCAFLYSGCAADCDELYSRYAALLASLCTRWDARLLGSTPDREPGELSAVCENGAVRWRVRSVSGRSFEALDGVCVYLSPKEPEDARLLTALAHGLSHRKSCAALPYTLLHAARASGLAQETPGAFFCYVSPEDDTDEAQWLDTLSLVQKQALWQIFLTQGVCPAEFYWLDAVYCEGASPDLLEWELALRAALHRAGMDVRSQPGAFRVLHPDGSALRLDFAHGCAAERMLLKLLFPAVPAP